MNLDNIQIGLDAEKIKRFENLDQKNTFVTTNFTKNEIKYCFSKTNPSIHLAGIFCAKEAVIKTMKGKINLREIEITHTKNNMPEVKINCTNKIKDNFKVSITHTTDIAIATALRQENDTRQ